ncbi:hypothetical protein PTKIN_Ptkin01aG0244800 [Pterospermum kingtungense]
MEVENNVQIRKFTWKIENFSSIKDKKLYSEIFYVGGYPWKLLMFPKGNGVDHISIYLTVADSATLPDGWSRYAKFKLALLNQIDPQISTTGGVTQHEFKAAEDDWGFTSFLPLSKLHDPTSGCLVNDSCLLEAYISTDRTIDLKSHKLIVEVGPGKVKGMEANYGKAAIDNQKTLVKKPEEITTFSPGIIAAPAVLSSPGQDKTKSTIQNLPTSRSSFLSDTIEAEVPKTEDMDTFFTSLEYELGSSNIVSSQEEAKEALAKIEGALNMTLTNFHDLGKSYPLKKAFKTLYSFDCSSTITDEQKTELLAMEESLKELPDRAAKAVQDRKLLSEKESVKLTVTRNLERSLVKFKEAKTEEEKVEQKIAALYKQVDEEQKNKENILTEMKEIFRISKELKMELEAIEKELPEYEAKAKVAEEEQKTVEAKWVRMKDLISSIKEKI